SSVFPPPTPPARGRGGLARSSFDLDEAAGAGEAQAHVDDAAQRLGVDLQRLLGGLEAAAGAGDLGLELRLLLALRRELAIDGLRVRVAADELELRVGRLVDAGLEGLRDVLEQDGAERAELLLDDLDLAHERLEHAVFSALRVEEVVAAHLGR